MNIQITENPKTLNDLSESEIAEKEILDTMSTLRNLWKKTHIFSNSNRVDIYNAIEHLENILKGGKANG